MIIIFEQDLTVRDGKWFKWLPYFFTGKWNNRRTRRIAWGLWSISYYPDKSLRAFFDSSRDINKGWITDKK